MSTAMKACDRFRRSLAKRGTSGVCDWCTEGVLSEPDDDARRVRRRRHPVSRGQLALRHSADCDRPRPGRSEEPPLWAVTVTLGGEAVTPAEARAALER